MTSTLQFLPAPRQMQLTGGTFALPATALILLDGPIPQALRPAAERLQRALSAAGGIRWEQVASTAVPSEQVALTLRVEPRLAPRTQGYRLHITPTGIVIDGHEPAGVFYGVCTLVQILEQAGTELPCLEIQDWPDIPARGVMLDISRDKVYRMETLYDLIDRLAGWKINQVQLYTEHTFAYRNHPLVWEKASPVTGEEIMALDAYCQERFIELVPNQNSFGHMERWLIHPPYAHLAETHDEFDTPWGTRMKGPFSLAPEHPGSLALITSLYDELLPHFTSRMINVGCDETVDLGHGVSRAICEARGKGRVYLDFLLKVYADLKKRDRTMMFWGDIINNEHPELAAELPRDLIALNWGYEATHPFDVESRRFADSGVPFYVCPGTSTWCSLAGRTENALNNLLNAAENGVQYGAIGYLNTDWGDRGHWQMLPASYLGFVAGAAYSWALESNRNMDVPAIVSRFAFEDPSGVMGRVAYDLGNVYRIPGLTMPNGNALFWALQAPLSEVERFAGQNSENSFQQAIAAIDEAMSPIEGEQMTRPDADLIRREFDTTAYLMRHASKRGLLASGVSGQNTRKELAADMNELLEEYRAVWLARNRPGGLADSAGRLEMAAQDYQK
jgi:hexosaminidase